MIIDFHTHIYPPKIALKGVSYILDFYHFKPKHPIEEYGTITHLNRTCKEAGVTHKVLLAVAIRADQVESINQFLSAQLNETTFGYGTMHPDYPNPISELQKFPQMRFSGIKFHPDMQKFDIDDPKLFPVYDWAQENQFPILFHMGDNRYQYSKPHKLAKVLTLFPQLIVIASHFGGYQCWEESREYLAHQDIFFDTSSALPFLSPQKAKSMIRTFGVEKFLFGTDYPIMTAAEELARLDKLGLTADETDHILYKNAKQLLKL